MTHPQAGLNRWSGGARAGDRGGIRPTLGAHAASQHGAFTLAQALTCYTRAEVRARVDSDRWVAVHHGTYRLASAATTPGLRVASAGLSVGRPLIACLHTAAELHGFGILIEAATHVATSPSRPLSRRPDLWPHQLELRTSDVTELGGGIWATTPARTAVELARTLPRLDALPVLDAAIAAGSCTRDSLADELCLHAGRPGVVQARELVGIADGRAESPQESRLRLRCHDARLPSPTPQQPVLDRLGHPRYWLDLGWEDVMVGLEYDGVDGHTGRAALRHDRRRHNWLTDDGWEIFYATDLDVYRDYQELMRKVWAARSRRSRANGG